jgi:tyrosyl-tRNA synthetase
MNLSEELVWRGQIKDKTFQDITWLDVPKTFYLGADVGSSDSLTVGNLAIYMLARRLVRAGWKPIMLVGGATSLIGDPGGKTEERDLVSKDTVENNKKFIANQVKRLFDDIDFILVDNFDWFSEIKYLEFLRDVGKHYSMTELLQRDFIAQRIGKDGTGISYAEFSYSLIQGYDYYYLCNKYNVELQIGGSDQWGNMLSGVPLIRKKLSKEVHALSMPLVINKLTGKKFGKSEEGAIWLDGKKTSPYKFYQFWLNVDDENVEDYLKIYTDITKDDFDALMSEFSNNKSARLAQKTLAREVSKLIHGNSVVQSIERLNEVLFVSQNYNQLSNEDVSLLTSELPCVNVAVGDDLINAMVATKVANTNSEARRLLDQKAVYLNGVQVDNTKKIEQSDVIANGYVILRRGKNNNAILIVK